MHGGGGPKSTDLHLALTLARFIGRMTTQWLIGHFREGVLLAEVPSWGIVCAALAY